MSRDWKAYALERLHADVAQSNEDGSTRIPDVYIPPEAVDSGTQSEYGTQKENAAATIVTTADIVELIPMPEDAALLRAPLSSLRSCEKDATDLLHHIQREIALQLQEAGVSYSSSALDNLEAASQLGEKMAPRARFAQRRQLEFHTGHQDALKATDSVKLAKHQEQLDEFDEANATGYWRYALQQNELQAYTDTFAKRAGAMEEVRRAAIRRHQLFNDIDKQLKDQQEDLRNRLENARHLRRPEKGQATASQLVARYGVNTGVRSPTRQQASSSAYPIL